MNEKLKILPLALLIAVSATGCKEHKKGDKKEAEPVSTAHPIFYSHPWCSPKLSESQGVRVPVAPKSAPVSRGWFGGGRGFFSGFGG